MEHLGSCLLACFTAIDELIGGKVGVARNSLKVPPASGEFRINEKSCITDFLLGSR